MARTSPPPRLTGRPLFIAFASGAITYDCEPCGRCCKGQGYADELVHLRRSPELERLAPFVASPADAPGGLVAFHDFADGCRFLADDNACELHRRHGPAAKPRLCRLFPFSRLLDVDGLWVLLPHPLCPWTPSPTGRDRRSHHPTLLAELGEAPANELLVAPHPPMTGVVAATRLAAELAIRDAGSLAGSPRAHLRRARAVHEEHYGAAWAAPELDLWLDLLRCAGAPPPLSPHNARLFNAAVPLLRVLALPHLPLPALPLALSAFELWLRALRELGARRLAGDDLPHLFAAALPLVTLMAYAEHVVPEVPAALAAGEGDVAALWRGIAGHVGEPLGAVLLELLRAERLGALSVLTLLGRNFPHTLFLEHEVAAGAAH